MNIFDCKFIYACEHDFRRVKTSNSVSYGHVVCVYLCVLKTLSSACSLQLTYQVMLWWLVMPLQTLLSLIYMLHVDFSYLDICVCLCFCCVRASGEFMLIIQNHSVGLLL